MKKAKRLIQTASLALAGFSMVCPAKAGVVKYTIGDGGLEGFNVGMDGASYSGALAGGISITQNPVANSSAAPQSYVTVCTDIGATLYLGTTYKYNTPTSSFSGLTGIDPTWGAANTTANVIANGVNAANAAQAIQNAAYIFNTFGNLTSTGMSGSVSQLAAIQLAVWTALYDTTANGSISTGAGARFTFSGGDATAISDANTYIAAINASAAAGAFGIGGSLLVPTGAPLDAQGNRDGQPPQELLLGASGFGPGPSEVLPSVPEPATMFAGFLLLVPFGASIIRSLRSRKNA
jgi:hypothetical protein